MRPSAEVLAVMAGAAFLGASVLYFLTGRGGRVLFLRKLGAG